MGRGCQKRLQGGLAVCHQPVQLLIGEAERAALVGGAKLSDQKIVQGSNLANRYTTVDPDQIEHLSRPGLVFFAGDRSLIDADAPGTAADAERGHGIGKDDLIAVKRDYHGRFGAEKHLAGGHRRGKALRRRLCD